MFTQAQPWLTVKDVTDHVDMAGDSPAHAACQADHRALPAAHGADAVQRALHPRPVVAPKVPHRLFCCFQVIPCDLHSIQARMRGMIQWPVCWQVFAWYILNNR